MMACDPEQRHPWESLDVARGITLGIMASLPVWALGILLWVLL